MQLVRLVLQSFAVVACGSSIIACGNGLKASPPPGTGGSTGSPGGLTANGGGQPQGGGGEFGGGGPGSGGVLGSGGVPNVGGTPPGGGGAVGTGGSDPSTGGQPTISCGDQTSSPTGTVTPAAGATSMPISSELAACTVANCEGAHCATNLPSGAPASLFAQCADSSSCVPDGFLATNYQFALKTCATFDGYEGRCLSTCMPEVSGELTYLPQDACDCTERCAPCYFPWPVTTGTADTGVCTFAPGDSAKTAAGSNAFEICGNQRGVCVPTAMVPASLNGSVPKDTCSKADHVCAPIEAVQDPTFVLPACKPSNVLFSGAPPNMEGQYGVCVPSYLVADDLPAAKPFLKSDGCPNADDLCGPCNNPTSSPPNQPTGACPP